MKETAERLGVTIPTISDQIRRLEEELNQDLLIRHCRRLERTQYGNWIYNELCKVFEPFEELMAKGR